MRVILEFSSWYSKLDVLPGFLFFVITWDSAVYSWEEATLLDLLVQDDEDRVIGTYSAPIADFLVPSDTIDRWIDLETQQTKVFMPCSR